MGQRTALYDQHVSMGAKIVDFAGWDMPIHYGSQLQEHHQVRREAGMFDVSHMTVVDIQGDQAKDFLRYLLANDVARLKEPGKALYSCMLNTQAGVIDDLIVYYRSDNEYRMVVNAATRDKDLDWLNKQSADYVVSITERPELAMIAVQGPHAIEKFVSAMDAAAAVADLGVFYARSWQDMFIARTGYTGEDGLEIILPHALAADLWQRLADTGVAPIGLGARDTLRLEAGMNLYGTDMDESTTPLESGLGWTVAWEPADRDFIGRAPLEQQRNSGATHKLVGLVLDGKGVLRNHQKVLIEGIGEGEITSGSFSPTLNQAIALARIPKQSGTRVSVDMRGKQLPATVVKPPFVRNGKSCLNK